MSETERLQQRIEMLERQLELTRRIANIDVATFVFDGPSVANTRLVPAGVVWEEHTDRSTWPTMRDVSVMQGGLPEHYRNVDIIQSRVDVGAADFETEYPIALPDGAFAWKLARGVIRYDAQGAPLTIEAVAIDITAVHQSQQQLRKLTENVETALGGSDTSLWGIEVEGDPPKMSRNVWVVGGAQHVTGETDRALAAMVAPEYRDTMLASMNACIRGETAEFVFEHQTNMADGGQRWRFSRGVPIRDAEGKVLRVVGTTMDITAVKESERELRTLNENVETALRGSDTSMWGIDLDDEGKLTPRMWITSGIPNLPGDRDGVVRNMIPPEYQAQNLAAIYACVRGETDEYVFEYPASSSGSAPEQWRYARGRVIRDANGKALRLVGTSMDITARKGAEEEARRNRERLEFALVDSKSGTWDFDLPDGTLATSKGTWAHVFELLGYSADDPEAKKFPNALAALVPPDKQLELAMEVQAHLDGNAREWEAVYPVRHRDGSEHWFLTRGTIGRDDAGRARRLSGITIDITERMRADQALRLSEQRFRGLYENAGLGFSITSEHGIFLDCNDMLCSVVGLSRDELLGQHAPTVLVPDNVEAANERLHQLVVGEKRQQSYDRRFVRKDGSAIWLNLTFSVVNRDPVRILGVFQDISERKRAEEALRESEQRFRGLYENATLGFALTDERGVCIDCNEMLCSVFGFTREEMIGRFSPAILTPDNLPAADERIRKLIAGEVRQNSYEKRIVRKDGSALWLQMTFSVVNRDPVRILGTFQDITARVTADEALRESESRFRGLYENAALPFAITDESGVLVDCNDSLCKLFGLSRGEVIGELSANLVNAGDFSGRHERIRQLVSGEVRQQSYERRIVRRDGTAVWLHLTFSLINREPIRLLGVYEDITARVTADQALRESEERFRAVFENAGVGFSISTNTGVFIECNDRLCELVGYQREELVHKHAASVLLPEEVGQADDRVRALVSGQVPHYTYDRQLHRRDGRSVWINFTFSVMSRDASGVPDRILGVFQDITARKNLEEDLRRTKERLELGVRNSGATIFDLDIPQPDLATSVSVIPRHGPAATLTLVGWENFGYDAATDITDPDRIGTLLHHPDDHEIADAVTQAYLLGTLPKLETEYRVRHADGTYSWRLVRGQAIRDEAGRPRRLIGSLVDITEMKRIETELRESEQRFRATFENSFIGFAIFDESGVFIDCNQFLCRFFGREREDIVGRSGPSVLYSEMSPGEWDEKMRQVRDGDIPTHTASRRFRRTDGTYGWTNLTLSVMARDATGKASRVLGIYLDVTQRMDLEESLRRTRERMELGIRASGTAIFEVELPHADPESGTVTLVNGWEQFGYNHPSTLPVDQMRKLLIHPEDQPMARDRMQGYLRRELPSLFIESRVIHSDGTITWWLTRGEAIHDPARASTRLLGAMVNITEFKQIQGELQAARQAAELANRAKDEFLANVSHEIRTPMNAILGMTELALDASETAHQRQLLSTVKVAARNLLHVINDLLDFSKITAGKLALDSADFSLRAAIGDTLRSLAVRAHRKGLELLCDVQPDVPDIYYGDAGRVRQVLMNLIGNAIKFTARGEVVITVSIDPTADRSDDAVPLRFTVRDTGIGIAAEKHAAIFRAFEQEDASTTRKFGGTGLGLTISQQLAALMGGRITVESEPGKGSTFAFTAHIERSSKPEWRGVASPGPLEGIEVLVVDDNETNRHILLEWFANWRMRATAVGDAAATFEALERAHESATPFALVLLDSRMPDIDGITLAQKIRERFGPSAHRLILLSSDHSPGLPSRARDAGADAYLLKPVQQSELLETIWTVMSAASADASSSGVSRAPSKRLRALHVLAAEDNELNVALLRELLDQRGHRVTVAGDGRTALDLASTVDAGYDAMLLDLHMPEMDGFEVVQAIRERERETGTHLPIIALTARSSARDREKAIAAGMDEFLSKPIEVEELFAALDRVAAALPAKRQTSRLLDARAIVKMSGGRPAVLDRLAEVFRRTVPEQMAAARAALDARDFERLRVTAHKLAGTLSAFSTIAGALASTLEEAAVGQDLELCTTLASRLQTMCGELVEDTRGLTLEALEPT